jgi:hypothetical protein
VNAAEQFTGIRALSGQRPCTRWFGLGLPPLLTGALTIAFAESALLCDLPGLIAALLTQRTSPTTSSPERIRSHPHLDLCTLLSEPPSAAGNSSRYREPPRRQSALRKARSTRERSPDR